MTKMDARSKRNFIIFAILFVIYVSIAVTNLTICLSPRKVNEEKLNLRHGVRSGKTQKQNRKLQRKFCGIPHEFLDTTECGSIPANFHFIPWFAKVIGTNGSSCGASFISSSHVITAAHCVKDADQEYFVHFNNVAFNSTIEDITAFPDFTDLPSRHIPEKSMVLDGISDIAILKLETTPEYVIPLCLPQNSTKHLVVNSDLLMTSPRGGKNQKITMKNLLMIMYF